MEFQTRKIEEFTLYFYAINLMFLLKILLSLYFRFLETIEYEKYVVILIYVIKLNGYNRYFYSEKVMTGCTQSSKDIKEIFIHIMFITQFVMIILFF